MYNAPAQKLRPAILGLNNSGILKFWEVEKDMANREDSPCQLRLSQICYERRYVHCEHVKRGGC
jgi:hypothetical protein